jgi:pantoate--beta-alanine ligase
MGNLHKGHVNLFNLAHEHAERVVVSIFVNPTQFGPGDDYAEYPRTLDTDARRLARSDVDVLFSPSTEEIYPEGCEQMTSISVKRLSEMFCGVARPGHFDGVTSVVCRLFNIIAPDVAIFGQKDYQQLLILRRMVSDLHIPVKIIAGQTQREKSGLAMSSRNQYLSEEEQKVAPTIYWALADCRQQLLDGQRDFDRLEAEGLSRLQAAGLEPEFFAIRKAADLLPPDADSERLVILTGAQLGAARLIDNVLVEL